MMICIDVVLVSLTVHCDICKCAAAGSRDTTLVSLTLSDDLHGHCMVKAWLKCFTFCSNQCDEAFIISVVCGGNYMATFKKKLQFLETVS